MFIAPPPLERLNVRTTLGPGCMIWAGHTNSKGYGKLKVHGQSILSHRFAYESYVGPIPSDMTVDHLCQNKLCQNTAHMELVSGSENQYRRWQRV